MNEILQRIKKMKEVDSKLVEKVKWYREHRAQIVAVVLFCVGALGGNVDRVYEALPDMSNTQIKSDIEALQIDIKDLKTRVDGLPSNHKEIEEKFPEVKRLDLSILSGN